MATVLDVGGLTKRFGGLAAVTDVSFQVGAEEILGLIGPNGAGKTTTISLISGFLRPDQGKVHFKGENITGVAAHVSAAKGLVRTFQNAAFFAHLTVFEHLFLACLQSQRASSLGLFFNSPTAATKEKEAIRKTRKLMEVTDLGRYEQSLPSQLTHGYQRWLSLAMALALDPALLLLDEPLSGMNAAEIDNTLSLLRDIRQRMGLSILLVEHNMRAVMSLCDRIVVLHYGRKLCEGDPAFVRQEQCVVDAYLGGDDGAVA